MDRKWSEVWIPKIGWVRFRRHRNIPGIVRNAKVSSIGWEVSFGVAAKPHIAPPNGKPGVGVDFGVACSGYLSDGEQGGS